MNEKDTQVESPRELTIGDRIATFAAFTTIAIAAILIGFGTFNIVQSNRQQESLEGQTARTNQLIEDVKALTKENKKLNQQNVNYAFCNAELVARFTQTQQAIYIQDLENCILTSFPEGEGPDNQSSNSPANTLQPTVNSQEDKRLAVLNPQQSKRIALQPAQPNQRLLTTSPPIKQTETNTTTKTETQPTQEPEPKSILEVEPIPTIPGIDLIIPSLPEIK